MFFLDAPVGVVYQLVAGLAGVVPPVVAIVVLTVAVRAALLPLSVRQARGERERARLLPQVRVLQERHRRDPERQRRELARLYEKEGVSPAAGCLAALAQWPFFAVLYRLFVSASVGGQRNVLLAHTLLGAPLGQTVVGIVAVSGPVGAGALVCYGLLGAIAAVAWWSARRAEGGGLVRLLPYATVGFACLVPLAAAVYLLTSGAWTAAERALLRRSAVPA